MLRSVLHQQLAGAAAQSIETRFKGHYGGRYPAAARLLETDPAVRDTNQHNTTIWYDGDTPYLVFPGNQSSSVYTTDLAGKLLHTLGIPTADSFELPSASRKPDSSPESTR